MINLLTNITIQIVSPIYLSLWDIQIKWRDKPLHLRNRYIFGYMLEFIEDLTIILLCIYNKNFNYPHKIQISIFVFMLFVIGIITMITFYVLVKPQYTTPREKIEEYNNILDIHNIPNGVQWRYLHRRKPLVGPGDESNETREIDSNSSDIVRWCKKDGYAWRLIAELDDELDANGNFENKILLQSNDDEVFEVDEYVIRLSTKLQIPAQGTDEEDTVEAPILKIKEANSAILKKVIEWCHYHKADPLPQDESNTTIPNWDAEFLKVDNATLFKLTMAADYLGIQGLIDVTYELVANVLE
uniref:XK-related protein n=1 Tax=Acrobeloides nanus TaxID=290746 RepID=A0A914C674_9BILA